MDKLGWTVAADPEQGFAVAAAAALRVHGVEVCAGQIALTHEAALDYSASPWVAGTPLCDAFDMGDKTPTSGNGGHPDEGDDADVEAALARDGPPPECGGQPAEFIAPEAPREDYARPGRGAGHEIGGCPAAGSARREALGGGPGLWEHMGKAPTRQAWRFVNSEFVAAAQQRLGALARPPSALACQIRCSDGSVCGALLGGRMRHANVCPRGYIRVHKAMAASVVNEATRAGADVDIERYAQELMRQTGDGAIEDAKMDAVVSWPASGSRILVDASVGSAASARYQRMGAATKCGVAAHAGDKGTISRHGQAVWPCTVELRGRLSERGRAVPQRLVIDSLRSADTRPAARDVRQVPSDVGGGRSVTRCGRPTFARSKLITAGVQ